MTEPSLNRRAFLRGMAAVEPVTEGQTLTRRQFTLVAFIAAIICAFLPREAAEALLRELFGTEAKTRANADVFDLALKTMYGCETAPDEMLVSPKTYEWLSRVLTGRRSGKSVTVFEFVIR